MIAGWLSRIFGVSTNARPAASDPRKEARKSVKHTVTVHVDGRSIECRTINLSASGALIDTALETAVGSTVQVEAGQLPRLVAARVARIGAHSTAIRFHSIELGSSLLAVVTAEDARAGAAARGTQQARAPVRAGTRGR